MGTISMKWENDEWEKRVLDKYLSLLSLFLLLLFFPFTFVVIEEGVRVCEKKSGVLCDCVTCCLWNYWCDLLFVELLVMKNTMLRLIISDGVEF
jgi:hypothetical protein